MSDGRSPSVALRQRTARSLQQAEPQPMPRPPARAGRSADANTNPNANPEILDGIASLRASPDGGGLASPTPGLLSRADDFRTADASRGPAPQATSAEPYAATEESSILSAPASAHVRTHNGRAKAARGRLPRNGPASETAAADLPDQQPGRNKRKRGAAQHVKVDSAEMDSTTVNAVDDKDTPSSGDALRRDVGVTGDAEAEEELGEDEEDEVREALARPPPVNSDYLPLPWKGRLGYVGHLSRLCLQTS